MTNKTVTTSEARTQLYSLVDEVGDLGMSLTITKNGIPKAIMMCADEFESWVETLNILGDKKLMVDLKKSEEDFKAGRFITLEEANKQLGLD